MCLTSIELHGRVLLTHYCWSSEGGLFALMAAGVSVTTVPLFAAEYAVFGLWKRLLAKRAMDGDTIPVFVQLDLAIEKAVMTQKCRSSTALCLNSHFSPHVCACVMDRFAHLWATCGGNAVLIQTKGPRRKSSKEEWMREMLRGWELAEGVKDSSSYPFQLELIATSICMATS